MTKGLDSVRVENINSGRTEQRESIISSDSEESKSPSKFTNPAAVVSKWWEAVAAKLAGPACPARPAHPVRPVRPVRRLKLALRLVCYL